MDRINGAGHVNHRFVTEDAATNRPPTEITDAWLNGVQEELLSLIEEQQLEPSDGDLTQVSKAIKMLLQKSSARVSVAGGTADAITAAYTPAISGLSNGMTLYVRAKAANATTAPTFTPASGAIAAKTIVKGTGSALVAGDIAGAAHWLVLQYDTALDQWVLMNPAFGFAATAAKFDRSTKSATTEFAMRALGNFSGVIQYNSSQDLTADNDIGKLIVCGGAGPYTLTIPAANSCPAGSSFWVMSQAATVMLQRLGTNAISLGSQNSLTSVTIGQGDFLCMTNYNGTDTWYVSLGTPLLKVGGVSGVFGASIGASGFKTHPSGLIKQYGVASSLSSDEVRVITLPTSFKTAMRVPLLTGDGASPLVRVHALGLSSFQVQNKGTAGQNIYWEVEGS